MEPTIAADVVFGNLSEKERQEMVALMVADFSPYPAAEGYFIQDCHRPTPDPGLPGPGVGHHPRQPQLRHRRVPPGQLAHQVLTV
jgi:hypothetical protein